MEALCDNVITEKEDVDEYHKQMLSESIYLQRLVNDLLDLSRLQNTDFSLQKVNVNLCGIISESIRSARKLAQEKNVKINFTSDKEVEEIYADFDRIRQMILIILDNAIKFSETDSIVDVEYKNNILTITDYGIGIKKEDIPHIFDRFYKTRSEKNKAGTGLGLAIAKQIALRHDIKVSLKSIENEFTSFSFDFSETCGKA